MAKKGGKKGTGTSGAAKGAKKKKKKTSGSDADLLVTSTVRSNKR